MMVHGAPSTATAELLNGFQVARLERVLLVQVLLTDCEYDEAARFQCVEHIVEAACWQKVCSQATCAGHHVERTFELRGKSLFADDV